MLDMPMGAKEVEDDRRVDTLWSTVYSVESLGSRAAEHSGG